MSSNNYGPFQEVLLDAVTVDETIGRPVNCLGYPYLVLFIVGTGTTSSGVVTVEEAPTAAQNGTWSSITTINASDVTAGATKAYHFPEAAYNWVRVRVSTAIGGGGSITAYLSGC